ncbi:Protein of unknown function [Gryllus bimaculatus]|nr:Protein of unknown function [Gryllus bimaculatus]
MPSVPGDTNAREAAACLRVEDYRERRKRTRASRESREKAKRSYSEEEEGEGEEEEDTRIRWEDVPKLGHMLFPLLRPSPLTPLTRDTAAQQFLTPIASLT